MLRLNTLAPKDKPQISVDGIIWHLVKIFGSPCEYSLIRKCEKLVTLIGLYSNQIKVELKEKENLMDCAVQGELIMKFFHALIVWRSLMEN